MTYLMYRHALCNAVQWYLLAPLDQVVVGAEDVVEIRVGDVGGQHRWIIDEFEMVVPRLAHAAQ